MCFCKSFISKVLISGSGARVGRPGQTENFGKIYAKYTVFAGKIRLSGALRGKLKKVVSRLPIERNLQKEIRGPVLIDRSPENFSMVDPDGLEPPTRRL